MAYYEKPELRGRTWHLDLWYPTVTDNPDAVTIGLMDVRAADQITVRYDFDRDGWAISMDRTRERDGSDGMEVAEPDVEVAFIPAWNEDDEGADRG